MQRLGRGAHADRVGHRPAGARGAAGRGRAGRRRVRRTRCSSVIDERRRGRSAAPAACCCARCWSRRRRAAGWLRERGRARRARPGGLPRQCRRAGRARAGGGLPDAAGACSARPTSPRWRAPSGATTRRSAATSASGATRCRRSIAAQRRPGRMALPGRRARGSTGRVHRCERAADAVRRPASLALLAEADPARLRLHLVPGTALVASALPDRPRIWQAHRSGEPTDRFAAGARGASPQGRASTRCVCARRLARRGASALPASARPLHCGAARAARRWPRRWTRPATASTSQPGWLQRCDRRRWLKGRGAPRRLSDIPSTEPAMIPHTHTGAAGPPAGRSASAPSPRSKRCSRWPSWPRACTSAQVFFRSGPDQAARLGHHARAVHRRIPRAAAATRPGRGGWAPPANWCCRCCWCWAWAGASPRWACSWSTSWPCSAWPRSPPAALQQHHVLGQPAARRCCCGGRGAGRWTPGWRGACWVVA